MQLNWTYEAHGLLKYAQHRAEIRAHRNIIEMPSDFNHQWRPPPRGLDTTISEGTMDSEVYQDIWSWISWM